MKVDDIATIVGKVGYASSNWLVYLKGGFAGLRINVGSLNTVSLSAVDSTAWASGWTLGGGVDYLFSRNWIGGIDATTTQPRSIAGSRSRFSIRPVGSWTRALTFIL